MNLEKTRKDFPTLGRRIDGKEIVYLDNACMTLKPRQVIKAMDYYYEKLGACGGKRSSHDLSRETQEKCKEARKKVAKFINASPKEVMWTRNTTEGINLVANSLDMGKNENIVCSSLDHHSGLLPLWKLSNQKDVNLKIVEMNERGLFDTQDWDKKIDDETKLVSLLHVSNVTGTQAPIEEITKIAHENDAYVLLDGAQSVPHQSVDAEKLDVDFLAFSLHKMCGPTGMGVLYGKKHLLQDLDTFLVGGDTIRDVQYKGGEISPEFLPVPKKFEAGLQNYAGIIGAGAAVDYLQGIEMDWIETREEELVKKLVKKIDEINEVKILGPDDPEKRKNLVSFTLENEKISEKDLAEFLNTECPSKICVRSGHHCTAPFHHSVGIDPTRGEGSVRASLYFYNTQEEISQFTQGVEKFLKEVRI